MRLKLPLRLPFASGNSASTPPVRIDNVIPAVPLSVFRNTMPLGMLPQPAL